MPLIEDIGNDPQCPRTLLIENGFDHRPNVLVRDDPRRIFQVSVTNGTSAERNHLIQQAQRITHAPFAGAGQRHQTSVFDVQTVLLRHMTQASDKFPFGDTAEIVMLAAR